MSEEKRQPKTKEELEALKKEIADLYKKLSELSEDERKEIGIYFCDPNELTDEEMSQVVGGAPGAGFLKGWTSALSTATGVPASLCFLTAFPNGCR